MYKVKVIVEAREPSSPDKKYSKTYCEGLFVPKQRECPISKIKAQVGTYLARRLEKQNHGVVFEFSISVSKLKDDFMVCEDKE